MAVNPSKFAELLTRAVNRIHANEGKQKTVVRDELGYAAGREGRTAVDYWCRGDGHVPARLTSVEGLAREIARRRGLSRAEMEAFLVSADHPDPQRLCRELYPAEQTNGAGSLSWQPETIQPPPAQPAVADSAVLASQKEAVLSPEGALKTASDAPGASQAPGAWRLAKTRRFLFLLGLAALAAMAAMVWLRVTAKTEQLERSQLQLVTAGEQRIRVESEGRSLLSGGVAPIHTAITVTFRVLNNGVDPLSLRSLTIGVRGPGATCHDNNAQRWSALDVPFPAITDLTLQPGQVYEYRGSRALYLPGAYFLEPVEQDTSGHWGGIPPFTCVDLMVVASRK